MQQNIAKAIGRGWSPELTEAMKLAEAATRLDRALKVTVRWMKTAREDSAELFHEAEYSRDKIEEELARVCFEMEVESRRKDYSESGAEDQDKAAAGALSDTLLSAYCTLRELLRELESDLFADGSPRARYALMGALLVAMDASAATRPPGEAKSTA